MRICGTDFQFLAWKDDRRAFYAVDPDGRPVVVTPEPPSPPGAEWVRDPFPESAPLRITEARLAPPPCRGTEAEAQALIDFAGSEMARGSARLSGVQATFCEFALSRGVSKVILPAPWELAWIFSGGEVLYPEPADASLLQANLKNYLRQRKKEKRSRLRQLETATPEEVAGTLYGSHSGRLARADEVAAWRNDQKHLIDQAYQDLNWTLDDIIDGKGGLLETHLHSKWLKKRDCSVEQLHRESSAFERWLAKHLVNRRLQPVNHGVVSYDFYLSADELQKWKAAITHAIAFESGHRVYLTRLEIRKELRPAELQQVAHYGVVWSPKPVPVRSQKSPKKRGRPKEYDAARDRRVLAGWESGHFRRYEDYARELGLSCRDVMNTLQRARARRRALERATK